MANTEFFKKVSNPNKNSLTWKDILSDSFRKHSKEEFEYAITAGFKSRRSNGGMLDSWRKPWVWFSFLKWSIVFVLFVFAVNLLLESFFDVQLTGLYMLNFILPAFVVTLTVMILLWELNVPRDISVFNMIVYFAVGGILSLVITGILLALNLKESLSSASGLDSAVFAPVIEEPAKLIAGIVFIIAMSKKGRITGLTGLLIGAGVGAGFTGVETMQYLIEYSSTPEGALRMAIMRSVLIGGHILFCAPYTAMLCLNFNKYDTWLKRLTDKGFLISFAISCVVHAIWNFFGDVYIGAIIEIPLIMQLLYVIKLCLNQAIRGGNIFNNSSSRVSFVQLQCIQGSLAGRLWQIPVSGRLTVGRDRNCDICVSDSASVLSRNHCVIYFKDGKCIVKDLNSTNGTFVGKMRINPGEGFKLFDGQVVSLGTGKGALKIKIQIVNS